MTSWAGHGIDLASNSSISKPLRVNMAFRRSFFKEYLISFLMICRLIDFAIAFKVCGIIGISKIVFFAFSGTERVKRTVNIPVVNNDSSNFKQLKLTLH